MKERAQILETGIPLFYKVQLEIDMINFSGPRFSYVDNRLMSTTTPQTLGGYWSFNDKFFLILNNAVNSVFSGSWANLQSSTMTIDWVRSYQLNGFGEVTTK